MSIAAGARWATVGSSISVPKKLLIWKLKLISPRLIVTGSISSRTRRTAFERQSNTGCSRNGVLRRSKAGIASWMTVPTRIPTA